MAGIDGVCGPKRVLAIASIGVLLSGCYVSQPVAVEALPKLNGYRAPTAAPVMLPVQGGDPVAFTSDAELSLETRQQDCSPPVCSDVAYDESYTSVDVAKGRFHGVATDGTNVDVGLADVDSASVGTYSAGRTALVVVAVCLGVALGALAVVGTLGRDSL
jgi:hypothetical protein